MIAVIDPDDPRIDGFRDIRERDLVGRAGRFIAEGEVVLRMLLGPRSRFAVESALIAEKRIAGLADLIAAVPDDVPVFAASQPVLDRIAGFPMHRGVLAIGRQGQPQSPEALLQGQPDPALVVVALGIANHDNLGGIFRNAAAFGAGAVLLDSDCCDPLYRKAIRVSVGTTLIQPFAQLAVGTDPVGLLADRGFEVIGLSPRGAIELAELRPSPRVALLLGSEGPGLPEAVLTRVKAVRIAMAGAIDSLNVATTSGIALHHLSRIVTAG